MKKKKDFAAVLKIGRDILGILCLLVLFVVSWKYTKQFFPDSAGEKSETAEKKADGTYCTLKSNSLDGVPIYANPGDTEQIGFFPEGKCCRLHAVKTVNGKKWAKVSYCGLNGWMKKKMLHRISSEEYYIKKGTKIYINSITEKGISGYEEPSTLSEVRIRGLKYGQEFSVEEMSEGWAKISSEGQHFWINMYHAGSYPGSWWKVETLSSAQEINFREEPGENQSVICKIPEKTELKITEYKNGWGKTEYEGSSGWVMLHYLTPIKERK